MLKFPLSLRFLKGMPMLLLLEKFFFHSYWTILFILLCLILLERGLKTQREEYAKLSSYMQELYVAKDAALKERGELHLRINSESDPAWIEVILMRSLGMVPEGYRKVFFQEKE